MATLSKPLISVWLDTHKVFKICLKFREKSLLCSHFNTSLLLLLLHPWPWLELRNFSKLLNRIKVMLILKKHFSISLFSLNLISYSFNKKFFLASIAPLKVVCNFLSFLAKSVSRTTLKKVVESNKRISSKIIMKYQKYQTFIFNLSSDKNSIYQDFLAKPEKNSIYQDFLVKPEKPISSNFTFISNLAIIYRSLFLSLSSRWIRQNPMIIRIFFELFSKQGCAMTLKKK